MIDIAELERIIAFAVPIESKDCKRVVAKKEWRREELKKMIAELIDKEAAFKLAAIVVAASVEAERERVNPVPDFSSGGVVNAPFVAITGNDDRPEYIIPTDRIDEAIKQMERMRPTESPDFYLPESDMFEILKRREQNVEYDQTAEEGKI